MPKHNTSIIKFGGSLLSGDQYRNWIQAIRALEVPGRIVIVPGGGKFADAVRHNQTQLGISTKVAHRMAIWAMRQVAEVVLEHARGAFKAETFTNLLLEDQPGIYLWLPNPDELNGSDLPQDWGSTSDSIALWLARKLEVDTLILLKSVSPPSELLAGSEFGIEGYVDAYFPRLAQGVSFPIYALGPEDRDRLPEIMKRQS